MILCFGSIAIFGLLFFHIHLCLANQTTWEFISRNRITYLKDLDSEANPFDKGVMRNLRSFLFPALDSA
jgi:palmitoyltransferase